MSANTKIVVLRRKELLYTGIFAALGVLFVILLLMLLLPGKAADTSGAPDSPDSTAETVMPDNAADLGRIPQSAQTEDVSTGAVADTDAVLDNASGPAGDLYHGADPRQRDRECRGHRKRPRHHIFKPGRSR